MKSRERLHSLIKHDILKLESIIAHRTAFLWLVLICAPAQWCSAAAPVEVAAPRGALNEQVWRVAVKTGERETPILVTLFRPDGNGPFPLAVINHGSPRNAQERRALPRYKYTAQSTEFVKRGFAVAVPTRRGYGQSEGEWAENYGGCDTPDYHRAGLETARDIVAATEAIAMLPFIDRARVVLVGQSAGGWGSLAATTQPPAGTVAVINFAGGRGSRGPDDVCYEQKLVEAAAQYGAKARVPSLWIYAENDKFFGPRLAQAMFAAYTKSGAGAEFVTAPATGDDGHSYFVRGVANWTPTVDKYLRELGLLTK